MPAAPPPEMPPRFRGRPEIDRAKCADGCRACAEACPTQAIAIDAGVRIDLGRCLFCTDCTRACPAGALAFTQDYRLATDTRQDLVVEERAPRLAAGKVVNIAHAQKRDLHHLSLCWSDCRRAQKSGHEKSGYDFHDALPLCVGRKTMAGLPRNRDVYYSC